MEGMVRNFYRGKRVLVTGDTGFKGAWLCLWLIELGAEVSGLALAPGRDDDLFNTLALAKRLSHTDGDIRKLHTVQNAFDAARPQIVFHLAAQSLVRASYAEPKRTFDTNVGGSVNVLEAARASPGLQALIYVTSDKCYRNLETQHAYREEDELGGRDPYSASKAAAEIAFFAYRESFLSGRLGAASVRAGNVIGGGDWAEDRIVPDCMRALRAGKDIVLRNPAAVRPWQHVLEPLGGYLTLAEKLCAEPARYSGAWNFGPEDEAARSVRDLAGAIVAHWGCGEVKEQSDADAPHEAGFLHLSSEKARQQLGWRARWDFDRAIGETTHWYKETAGASDVHRLTRQQILDYMETAQS